MARFSFCLQSKKNNEMKLLLVCALLFVSVYGKAQSTLTFGNLTSMQKGGISGINRVLLPKSWIFLGNRDSSLDNAVCNFKSITWAYAPSSKTSDAPAFVTLMKIPNCEYAVGYQTTDTNVYTEILAAINSFNMKMVDSSVEIDNDVTYAKEIYVGKEYYIQITVSSLSNNSLHNDYSFTTWRKVQ